MTLQRLFKSRDAVLILGLCKCGFGKGFGDSTSARISSAGSLGLFSKSRIATIDSANHVCPNGT